MKRQKINILIVTSVLALLALSAIQGYLIYNTYQLKKDVFIKETKKAVSSIDNTKEMDSLAELWYNSLTENLVAYKKENYLKKEVITRFKPLTDSLNAAFKNYYAKEINKVSLGYDLKYKKTIQSIVLFDNDDRDTIFSRQAGHDFFLFGENFPDEEGTMISKARWFTEHDYEDNDTSNGEGFKATLNIEIRTQDTINVIGWKRIIIRQMASLFMFSVILLLFVVVLFFYSIKILIKQKRIVDVRNDFINNITHELKTPLATLAIVSKSLRNKKIQDSAVSFSNSLDILDRQNNRLHKLIDQVMNNTLGSEEIILSKEKVQDDQYFTEVIEDFKLSVENDEIAFNYELELKKVALTIDKFLFTTALFNIMENAVKYGREKKEIHLKTERKENAYQILIRDNGIGIPEKEQHKIFEKFYRVTTGNVHEVKGLGLGLFYANQVVRAHHGSIILESVPNIGTTFIITIPIL